MRIFVAAALLILATSSHAQDSVSACASIQNDALRLTCFDAVAKAPTPATPPVTTKDMVVPIAPTDYKRVDPADMYVAPRKYLNKPIEVTRASCFYADKDDYRCITRGSSTVAIFVSNVTPEKSKELLENDCGTIKMISTPKCQRTFRFVPEAISQDQVDAMTNRVIYKAKSIEIVAPTSSKNR